MNLNNNNNSKLNHINHTTANDILNIVNSKLISLEYQCQRFLTNNIKKQSILYDIRIAMDFINNYQHKQIICLNFQQHGQCKFGDGCWFKHERIDNNISIKNVNNNVNNNNKTTTYSEAALTNNKEQTTKQDVTIKTKQNHKHPCAEKVTNKQITPKEYKHPQTQRNYRKRNNNNNKQQQHQTKPKNDDVIHKQRIKKNNNNNNSNKKKKKQKMKHIVEKAIKDFKIDINNENKEVENNNNNNNDNNKQQIIKSIKTKTGRIDITYERWKIWKEMVQQGITENEINGITVQELYLRFKNRFEEFESETSSNESEDNNSENEETENSNDNNDNYIAPIEYNDEWTNNQNEYTEYNYEYQNEYDYQNEYNDQPPEPYKNDWS